MDETSNALILLYVPIGRLFKNKNIKMKIYLNRKHSTIKMSPLDAEKEENQKQINEVYSIKYQKAENDKKKPKFKVGETVRIWLKRTAFHRGYYENYTREYFKIDKVLNNLPVPRYKLKDILDENIEGAFFEDELVLYTPTNNVYNIEKIIQTKGKGKQKKHLVQWEGWPSKFNSWVLDNELKKIS